MPTRRSKNQNLKGCYTYHERQKDKFQCQYGNFERRLGKDSVKDFDMCSISLDHAKTPVISPQGIVFDETSVLEYIIHEKAKNKRQRQEYKDYIQEKKDDEARQERIKNQKEINQFVKNTDSLVVRMDPVDNPLRSVRGLQTPAVSSNFWMAGTVRDSTRATITDGRGILKRKIQTEDGLLDGTGFGGKMARVVSKPDKFVKCPITKEPLEFPKMMKIKFKRIDESGAKSRPNIAGQGDQLKESKFCCAVSGDPLTNATKLVALRSTGDVISNEAYEKAVKKTMICPFSNTKLIPEDIIHLKRGGTGFASVNDLQRTEKSAAFMAS